MSKEIVKQVTKKKKIGKYGSILKGLNFLALKYQNLPKVIRIIL